MKRTFKTKDSKVLTPVKHFKVASSSPAEPYHQWDGRSMILPSLDFLAKVIIYFLANYRIKIERR